MITVNSTLSYERQTVPPIIPAVQGDTGRNISFKINDTTIPEGATAAFYIQKPSGNAIYNTAEVISSNQILVPLDAQCLAEVGENFGQVRILLNGDVVTSFDFILLVKVFHGIDAIESLTELNVFDQAVADAVADIQTEAEQIAAEVIASIPEDYTELVDDVDDLKQDYNQVQALANAAYVTETITDAAVASFTDGADDVPVKSLTVDVTPVQDLHGQSSPYPAGGGKNKLSPISAKSITQNGITFTSNGDGTYRVNGTAATGATTLSLTYDNPVTIKTGTYYMSVLNSNTPSVTVGFYMFADNNRVWDIVLNSTNKQQTVTVSSNVNGTLLQIYVASAGTVDFTLSPVLSTDSYATSFAPYSNICPISGWTGAKVTRTGVNVWDEEWESGSINIADGQNVTDTSAIRSKNYIPVKPNQTYYFVASAWGSNNARVRYYGKDKAYTGNAPILSGTAFTIPADTYFMRFSSPSALTVTTYNHDVSINYPSTDHDYHAYQGETYSISFPTEAGTVYGGTLDVTSGVLTVDRGFYTLTGSETWTAWDANAYYSACLPSDAVNTNNTVNCISSMLEGETTDAIYSGASGVGARASRLYISATEYANIGTFTGMQVCYKLATPLTVQLTPTEVTTLLLNNNIFADCGNVSVTYRADLKAYIDSVIS